MFRLIESGFFRIRHRGPDWSGCVISGNNIFCHERLAIVGVNSGAQPIVNHEGTLILTVNGEIYNYKTLKSKYLQDYQFVTYSDCEVIMYMYKEMGENFVQYLDGVFTFVLYDVEKGQYFAARDAIGVNTLYYGYNSNAPETYYFASEMKCLNDVCDNIVSFPPGHLYDSKKGFTQWYNPAWFDQSLVPKKPVDYALLRKRLVKSVKKRLMSEVPYGVLLSGGLDSSLIASIASRETRKMLRSQLNSGGESDVSSVASADSSSSDEQTEAFWPRLHSFSIGLKDKNQSVN